MLGSPQYDFGSDQLEINAGRANVTLRVTNTGDRAVQVGSHFHFFEANKALKFDREKAYGMHLDIPAGTAVRLEPGDTKEVVLVAYAGNRHIVGFNNLVDGGLDSERTRIEAIDRMRELKYGDGTPTARSTTARSTSARSTTAKGKK